VNVRCPDLRRRRELSCRHMSYRLGAVGNFFVSLQMALLFSNLAVAAPVSLIDIRRKC
jgi:hypothetical protein